MDEYPDPEEEYELMYAEELELMREMEGPPGETTVKKKPVQAKRSLDFTSPVATTENSNYDIDNTPDTQLPPNEVTVLDEATPVSNKRSAEELFGDIGDIDFDNIELPSKRQKTEEENDMDLINRILEERKLRQILSEPLNQLNKTNKSIYKCEENLSYNIPRWPFLPLTNSDGDRIYVRLESEEMWDMSLEITLKQPSLQSSYASTWQEARKILEEKQQEQLQLTQTLALPDEIDKETNLWVDKYRPESYFDLLSEEPVNRALLHWLHLWDKIVFKKEVKTSEPQQRSTFSKRSGQFQLTNKWKGKKESEPEVDEDGRPHHKVALLCGPPGVGKTTLAHLLAKLAGYRPVEINASDERSTEAFRNALQSATLMKSVLDAERRPNCLILDEIDGAPLPTVELLVKWCTATVESGKKKGKSHPLKRPVIAICNDLYATSLRPLRAVSLVVQVGGVSCARLAARLCSLAQREHVSIAPHVASALAARAQGDVRAAIQVLSFIRARAKRQLNMEDVENSAIGTKDCTKSLMQALQAIFTLNDNDKEKTAILKTIQAAGEYDRLAEGIFENYLTARVDARLHVACETLSWLRLHDAIYAWTLRTQNYSLYGMLPLCAVKCHSILATRATQRVKFPTLALEMFRRRTELDSVMQSVWRGSSPAVAKTRNALLLDVLPILPYLLSPVLRSANVQLCSENERASLRTCASAMCDYGLQYVQQRTQDGLYAFVLEPDVHKIAFFGSEERSRPPPAIRQSIAREQQLEIIRRNEQMVHRTDTKSDGKSKKDDAKKLTNNSQLPNHLQRLKPKEIVKNTPQVHKDFFGRIVPISQTQKSDATTDLISSSSVFYQYREGFNNAVRRNVRMKDLL